MLSVWERYKSGRRVCQEGNIQDKRVGRPISKAEAQRLVQEAKRSGNEEKFWDHYYSNEALTLLRADEILRDISRHIPGARIEVHKDGLLKYVIWERPRPVVYKGVAKRKLLGGTPEYEDLKTGETRTVTYGIGVEGERFEICLHRIGKGTGELEYDEYDHDFAGLHRTTIDGFESEKALEKIRDKIADLLVDELWLSENQVIEDYSRDERPSQICPPSIPEVWGGRHPGR